MRFILEIVVTEMTRDESKALKVGTRVRWKDNLSDEGIVTENDWSSVKITWDDKRTSVMHHNDMIDVAVVKKPSCACA